MNTPSEITDDEDDFASGKRLNPVGLLIGFISGLPGLVLPIIALIFGARSDDSGIGFILAVALAVTLSSLIFRWIIWRRFRYFIGAEEIRIESGLLNRQARSIPFDRIQDVSIEQKLLARLFELGEVKFETGGGEGEDAKLSYVTMDEGERLRGLIRERKDGAIAAQTETAKNIIETNIPDHPPIFAMGMKRVITFGLFEFSLVIFAVLFGVAQQFDFLLPFDAFAILSWFDLFEERGIDLDNISFGARFIGGIAALIAIIILGLSTGVIRTLLREYGFRLDNTGKAFRRRRGLTTLTDVAMPIHRVQSAMIETGFLRKKFGWHALKFISLAQDSKEEASHVAAPFARMEEITAITAIADIEMPDENLQFLRLAKGWWLSAFCFALAFIIIAILSLHIFLNAGPVSLAPLSLLPVFLIFIWLDWCHKSHARNAVQIYYRTGWWGPRLTITPQIKIQSVEIRQGPLARMLGLAEVEFGIAGGALSIPGLKLPMAKELREQVIEQIASRDFSAINRA